MLSVIGSVRREEDIARLEEIVETIQPPVAAYYLVFVDPNIDQSDDPDDDDVPTLE